MPNAPDASSGLRTATRYISSLRNTVSLGSYVRTGSTVAYPTPRTTDGETDLSGSEAFVWNSAFATYEEFQRMVRRAAGPLPPPGARQAQSRKLLDPDHFCFMHQWGPFRLDKSDQMDLFLRHLIALQVELLSRDSTVSA